MEVETKAALRSYSDRIANALEDTLNNEQVVFKRVSREGDDSVLLSVYDKDEAERAQTLIKKIHPDLLVQSYPEEESRIGIKLQIPEKMVLEIQDKSVSQALETIRNRIDQFGVAEPVVQREGENHITVQLPGIKDPQRAIELIGKTARLEFKLVDENVDANSGSIPADVEILWENKVNSQGLKISQIPLALKKRAVITGDMLQDAKIQMDPQNNRPVVSIVFDSAGARIFDQVTASNVGKRFAIVLDNTIYSAPVIQERISGGSAQISGSFTEKEANDLAIVLRAGSLPAPVKVVQNVTVGPSLGQDSIDKGLLAGAVGVGLVVLFMAAYYRFAGMIANLGMMFNVLYLMGALAVLGATLTLPGIAAIVLLVGMSVDSNVLIFERVKEELRFGKRLDLSIDAGYDKAFLTIMDSHVTALITAAVLFQFGTGPVKGFAVSLSLGVLINLFTSLVITRTIFNSGFIRSKLTHQSFGRLDSGWLKSREINFFGKKSFFFALSGIITIVGIVGIIQMSRGAANMGIDFSGGTTMLLKFIQPPSTEVARDILARHNIKDVSLQEIKDGNKLLIKVGKNHHFQGSVADEIKKTFQEEMKGNSFEIESSAEVGPSIGNKLKKDTLIAVAISMFGILCYIGWRFDMNFGKGAIISTLHDILAMVAVFFVMGKEINLLFVTAVLTIAGYSLTDTVVIFDRIRENLNKNPSWPVQAIFNRSLNEVLSRTIVTSVTTFLAAFSLFLFGGDVIRDFAFALVVGIVIATYSSIFIASPTVLGLYLRSPKKEVETIKIGEEPSVVG
jgi:SecD/SecF fusion protein